MPSSPSYDSTPDGYGYDSLPTTALRALVRLCGVRGRVQVAQQQQEAREAASAAQWRQARDAALVAQWPRLAQVRAKAQRGDYADDSDALWTPQERRRLLYARWRRETGRIEG